MTTLREAAQAVVDALEHYSHEAAVSYEDGRLGPLVRYTGRIADGSCQVCATVEALQAALAADTRDEVLDARVVAALNAWLDDDGLSSGELKNAHYELAQAWRAARWRYAP